MGPLVTFMTLWAFYGHQPISFKIEISKSGSSLFIEETKHNNIIVRRKTYYTV